MTSCLSASPHNCQNCAAARLCLPMGMDHLDLPQINGLISRRVHLEKGDVLIQPHDPFRCFFAVKQGALKSHTIDYVGREQIWGIYLLGELLGFEGIDTQTFPYYVTALVPSVVCEIPYEKLMQLIQAMPALQHQMFKLMSQRFSMDVGLPRNNSSLERLAAFLLSISTRLQRGGGSGAVFDLPLTRQELASYLGMTLETVSRLISRLKKEAIIAVDGKHVEVLSMRGLQKAAAT